jgi:hypothetical protein
MNVTRILFYAMVFLENQQEEQAGDGKEKEIRGRNLSGRRAGSRCVERDAFGFVWVWGCFFRFYFEDRTFILSAVTAETFAFEVAEAMKTYEKHVVCIDKTPDDFQTSLISLLNKAIKAYESRGPQLRHGIALDRQVTVILSQSDGPRPLCGIYFNLYSPYQKPTVPKSAKPVKEPIGGGEG